MKEQSPNPRMKATTTSAHLLTPLLIASASFAGAAISPSAPAEKPDAAGVEFFEKNIRPVLVKSCYGCHSKESGKQKGGLSLDTRELTRLGGESGHAVVPGDPDESLLMKAIRYEDKEMEMPPRKEGGKLPDDVIAKFEQWIRMGAPDPRDGGSLSMKPIAKREWDPVKAKEFWAFQLPKASKAPEVKDTAWPRNDVDRFILAAMENAKIKPVADADRTTLIRRVYFDLIGLPPRPDEVEAFVKDKSPNAYEKIVDRLLASPQFGERWGRHWLDVARYAESTGKERNFTFPAAWKYRDWVISSLNQDKPYNQFIREQVAGDLLPHVDQKDRDQHLIATGFLALGPKGLNEKNKEQFRMDLVDEQIDATTRAVTAVTVGCARCHDHKFDPISQRDYYAMAGIFKSTETYFGTAAAGGKNRNGTPLLTLSGGEEKKSAEPVVSQSAKPATPAPTAPTPTTTAPTARDKGIDARLRELAGGDASKLARLDKLTPEQKEKLLRKMRSQGETAQAPAAAPATPAPSAAPAPAPAPATASNNTAKLEQLAAKNPQIAERLAQMSPQQKEQALARLQQRFGGTLTESPTAVGTPASKKAAAFAEQAAKKKKGKGYAPAIKQEGDLCMGVMEGKRTDARILVRGEIDQPTETVPRGLVQVMTNGEPPKISDSESGRLQLADWLVSPTNPLTARVAVNRIWLHLFGAGLVRTADNFGATGEKPSHPELLDTLAVQFEKDGWSVKKMIRSLVLSHTYQLSGAHDSFANETDPDNRLLWHASQRRLDAESIRDAMLAASGELDIKPPAGSLVASVGDGYIGKGIRPEIFSNFTGKRRSVYLPIVRDFVPDMLEVFDFAEPSLVVASRDTTNVPSQALFMMNNDFVREQANAMAKRILSTKGDYATRLNYAYYLALGRPSTPEERQRADRYLNIEAKALVPVKKGDQNAAAQLAWATFCQALFASAEFRYVN